MKVQEKVVIPLAMGHSEFEYEILVAYTVDGLILDVDIMCIYGFLIDFKNNVLRVGQREIVLSTRVAPEILEIEYCIIQPGGCNDTINVWESYKSHS